MEVYISKELLDVRFEVCLNKKMEFMIKRYRNGF